MRLATFIAGLAAAVAITVIGSPSAHAQSQTITQAKQPVAKPAEMVVVNEGDTLTSIADTHQTTYVRLFNANTNIVNPDLIYPGDNLRIPAADEQLADRGIPAAYTAANPLPRSTSVSITQSQPSATTPLTAPVSGCGDNSYANFIYSHESGCRTTAISPNGCYGIGQACPSSKLAYCGADYACQNDFFTAYASKYGGWAGAYAFWVAHGWW